MATLPERMLCWIHSSHEPEISFDEKTAPGWQVVFLPSQPPQSLEWGVWNGHLWSWDQALELVSQAADPDCRASPKDRPFLAQLAESMRSGGYISKSLHTTAMENKGGGLHITVNPTDHTAFRVGISPWRGTEIRGNRPFNWKGQKFTVRDCMSLWTRPFCSVVFFFSFFLRSSSTVWSPTFFCSSNVTTNKIKRKLEGGSGRFFLSTWRGRDNKNLSTKSRMKMNEIQMHHWPGLLLRK